MTKLIKKIKNYLFGDPFVIKSVEVEIDFNTLRNHPDCLGMYEVNEFIQYLEQEETRGFKHHFEAWNQKRLNASVT